MTRALTDRQQEVLRHAADGLSIPETARAMHLAVGTIHYHQQVIVTALKARNMQNAVLLACQAGYLDGRRRRHGDHAGYAAHVHRGEDPCDDCKAGERNYRNQLRQQPKEAA